MVDFYGDEGCCLTCKSSDMRSLDGWNGIEGDGCLCYECKCSQCGWLYNHKCEHPSKTSLVKIRFTIDETCVISLFNIKHGFYEIIEFLKENNFRYNIKNSTWFYEKCNVEFVTLLMDFLDKFDIPYTYFVEGRKT